MGINLQSLSLTSAFSSIINFFRSQENQRKFKDMSVNGSEGAFLIRLLANIFSTLSYRIVAQSRENYLSTAALPSSNIGLAVNLGYSVFRGSNLKRYIRITPNGNYTFPHLSQIGTFNEMYNIYVLRDNEDDDVELVEGQPRLVKTVVGRVKEETIVADTSDIKIFSLFTTGISEDYVLFVGSKEVPTTKIIKEMTEDKYLVRTNPYSSVDIAYLNTFANAKYTYGVDSEITIRYIELADVGNEPYTADMFKTYGTLNGVSNISTFLPFEPVEDIKVTAPLGHETQNLIRSKQDYANRMRQLVPSAVSTDWVAVTPTYTQITYLKNDYTLLTDIELENILNLLKNERYFGTPLPDVIPPRRDVAHLRISIALSNKYKNLADINLDIKNILGTYYDAVLGSTFNTFDLERKIESLSYVKYARVSHFINEREPNATYQVGYMISRDIIDGDKTDTKYYMASKILGLSGESAPVWSGLRPIQEVVEIDTGVEAKDGSLVWRAYKKLPGIRLEERENNQRYGVGDFVSDSNYEGYMFKCVDIVKTSGFTSPDLSYAEAGDFFVDGNIVWVAKEYSGLYDDWSSSTVYSLGSSVNVPTSTDLSLECISYTGTAGSEEEIDFEDTEYPIISIDTSQSPNAFIIEGDKRYYFQAGDIITATSSEESRSYTVKESVFNGTNTVIRVLQDIDTEIDFENLIAPIRGTKDGQILWSVIEDPTNIQYPWSSYTTFDHTLEVIN